MPSNLRLRPGGFAAVLALALLALPAAADDVHGVDVDRERSVTHNDDGSVTIDKGWEKTRLASGATASGSSSKTVTRDEDGVSWGKSAERTFDDGSSVKRGRAGRTARDGATVRHQSRRRVRRDR